MTYVMSDIHGHYKKFKEMLELIQFSDNDTLYIIGDVIDRGSQPISLLNYILANKNIILLKGNHEDMMIKALKYNDIYYKHLWFENGGEVTYNKFIRESKESQEKILEYLLYISVDCDIIINNQKFYLVHGNYIRPEDEKYISDKDDFKMWDRVTRSTKGLEDKIVIVGHTPTKYLTGENKIMHNHNFYNIDCGMAGYKKGNKSRLACLCLNDLQEYYV